MGQYHEAMAICHQGIDVNPDDPGMYNNLGVCCGEQGRITEALDAYHRAIELRPDHVRAHYNLGITKLRVGRRGEAHYQVEVLGNLGDKERADALQKLIEEHADGTMEI